VAELALNDTVVGGLHTKELQAEVYDQEFAYGGSFGVRLSKGGRKAFFVIFSLHGKRKRMTLGNFPVLTVEEARKQALNISKRAKQGEDPAAEQKVYLSSESFGDLAQIYTKDHLQLKLSQKSSSEYQRIILKELMPLWGDRKLCDIMTQDVQKVVEYISQSRGVPVLASRVRAVASSIFSFAKSRGLIETNPAMEVAAPKAAAKRDRILNIEELHQLYRALAEESVLIQALFKILILTGQRLGRVLEMRWADVRIDTWHLKIPIYLVAQILHALKEAQESSLAGESLLFSSAKGADRLSISRAAKRLNRKMQANPAWNVQDLYRTFQYGAARIGIRPDVIDTAQQRKTSASRLNQSSTYDYSDDVRSALLQWAKAVIPPFTAPRGKKVVPLFG